MLLDPIIDLLSKFSIAQILIFIVLFALAFKGVVDFVDWFKNKIKKHDEDFLNQTEKEESIDERIDKVESNVSQIIDSLDNLNDSLNILIESDKDAIKAWITREHHYFCYQKGWIDDYSLDCIERRYTHYVEEKGNSFIFGLMQEIRALPKKKLEEEKM